MQDEDVFPVDTVVRIRKTGEFAIIVEHGWLRPELKRHFLHYIAIIEGRGDGHYAIYHDDVEWEAPPRI